MPSISAAASAHHKVARSAARAARLRSAAGGECSAMCARTAKKKPGSARLHAQQVT